MNRIVRSIMMVSALTVLVGASGCNLPTAAEVGEFINPPAEDRWYDGVVVYAGSISLEVRANPSALAYLHSAKDTCWVRLDATTEGFSSASYYLHARGYPFEFRNANTKEVVRRVTLTPDNIEDERVYEYLTMLDWLYPYHTKRFAP